MPNLFSNPAGRYDTRFVGQLAFLATPGPIFLEFYRRSLLRAQLLFGDQALHEVGPFLLISLNALVQQHLADL